VDRKKEKWHYQLLNIVFTLRKIQNLEKGEVWYLGVFGDIDA
jgi:hypothetical protein